MSPIGGSVHRRVVSISSTWWPAWVFRFVFPPVLFCNRYLQEKALVGAYKVSQDGASSCASNYRLTVLLLQEVYTPYCMYLRDQELKYIVGRLVGVADWRQTGTSSIAWYSMKKTRSHVGYMVRELQAPMY